MHEKSVIYLGHKMSTLTKDFTMTKLGIVTIHFYYNKTDS